MAYFTQLEKTFTALKLKNLSRLSFIESKDLARAHVPPFPPNFTALILNVGEENLLDIKTMLQTVYADVHPLHPTINSRAN